MHWHDDVVSQEVEVQSDGIIIVSWGFSVTWGTTFSPPDMWNNLAYDPILGDFRLLVNGIMVGSSDRHTWLKYKDTIYITGALPVTGGTVRIEGQARKYFENAAEAKIFGDATTLAVNYGELIVQYKRR